MDRGEDEVDVSGQRFAGIARLDIASILRAFLPPYCASRLNSKKRAELLRMKAHVVRQDWEAFLRIYRAIAAVNATEDGMRPSNTGRPVPRRHFLS